MDHCGSEGFPVLRQWTAYSKCPAGKFHPLPADIAVDVIGQKGGKAHHHADISAVAETCQHPQHDEYDVVAGVRQGEEGTSAPGEVHPKKCGGDGEGAWEHVGGMENRFMMHHHS